MGTDAEMCMNVSSLFGCLVRHNSCITVVNVFALDIKVPSTDRLCFPGNDINGNCLSQCDDNVNCLCEVDATHSNLVSVIVIANNNVCT